MIIEAMEGRTLFSTSVSEGYPGYYEISGTEAADTLFISIDQENLAFTLDNVTYFGVEALFVSGNGGDDSISVSSSGIGYIGASISGGDGDDVLTASCDASIWAGAGDDTLNLIDAFRGEVYGEGGHDSIYISGDCDDPSIDGGSGNDLIDASDNHYGVIITGGSGNDILIGSAYDDVLYGDSGADSLFGGGGNDVLYTGGNAEDTADGGDGYDALYGNTVASGSSNIEAFNA